ncbi:putative transcription factor B3-Domain family [Helianthus debilis subsp. tardiflorus]
MLALFLLMDSPNWLGILLLEKMTTLCFRLMDRPHFFLMVFKSCVHKNMFISKINPQEDVIVMADEFWREFYGKMFKGGQSTLYLGDRFWNVNMDGLTDRCVFSHGCSEMINELALDRRSTFVFSLHGNKIFEVSVFNHETGTPIQNNRVELVVLDDPIYVDDCDEFAIKTACKEECIDAGTVIEEGVVVESKDVKAHLAGFEDMFNDQDDAKFDTFFSSLLEMEDLKKKFKENWDSKTEGKGKASVVCDVDSTMKDDPKAKTIDNVNEDITLKDKSMSDMDLDSFLIPKTVMMNEPSRCSAVVSDAITNNTADVRQSVLPRKMKVEAAEPVPVSRKRSNLKTMKTDSFIEFTKVAENRLRLPCHVSDDLCLSVDNLPEVSVKNLRCEVTNIKTLAERTGDVYRYGFSKWSRFLKSNQIPIGATLFFKYVKSSQLLMLTKVVHKTTKKRGRA